MPPRKRSTSGAPAAPPVFVNLLDSDDEVTDAAAPRASRKSARIEKHAAMADEVTLLTFPSAPSKDSITLSFSDLRRLRPIMTHPGNEHLLLNDTLVDFYVEPCVDVYSVWLRAAASLLRAAHLLARGGTYGTFAASRASA